MGMFSKKRLMRSLKKHSREAKRLYSIYYSEGLFEDKFHPDGYFMNKVEAEKRCANRIRHLIVKLNHKS